MIRGKRGLVTAGLFSLLGFSSAANSTVADSPWLDIPLPTEERLQLLMLQLNTSQIYAFVQGDTVLEDEGTGVSACVGHISGNNTLGLPPICMGDGPAGVGNSLNNVTTFPAPVLDAATWNITLMYLYGQALAQEHKDKARNVVLSPTINILRSPLWARAGETFSEDPFLTSRLAVAQTLGIQSQKMLACPKHFAAYNQDTNRFGLDPEWVAYDSVVSKRVLHELYLPAFKAAVQEGNAAAIMCSYNRLNGHYTCENEWLLKLLKDDWGFDGFVVADWYFSVRSTVATANAGLDISMPGGTLVPSYGFPAYYGDLLVEAVDNGSVPFSRVEDMVKRLWRPMIEFGVINEPMTGSSEAVARTQEHLNLAQLLVEEGVVLLKNEGKTLPINAGKYKKIGVFGLDSTNLSQVSENHGGFVIDTTLVTQAPLDAIVKHGAAQNISVVYSEAYPGTGTFPQVPSSMFLGGFNVTYWTTANWTGPVNQTVTVENITSASFPEELWKAWPQVFSSEYNGTFMPNTSGLYHFSLTGQGDCLLYIQNELIGNMSGANFQNTVQAVANLTAGVPVSLSMKYSMGYSLSTGAYGVTLGVDVGNMARDNEADTLAAEVDLSIIFVSDRFSEGADNNLGLSLAGDQDAMISRLSKLSKKTLVVLNTNSAVLMPWIDDVDAIMEAWYSGQQVGIALGNLLFGEVNPSGKLPMTFPKNLKDTIQIREELEVEFSEGLYVGYKWYDEHGIEPLFPFGHGLSYTTFNLSSLDITYLNSTSANSTSAIVATTLLSNTGAVAGKQVVQLYVSYPAAANEPPKLLKGFEKVYLKPGQASEVSFLVEKDDLMIWDEKLEDWTFVTGNYTFIVGFSSSLRDIVLEKEVCL
ncbi:putative periplasmic beta-glucosidase precursor protein [Rutstroemia sp. NJR-2017a BBW]|nr:putative periplasmic beta-glucosidase precursor protein [Rutstroemia sp. NJR-2017a BBW]